MKFMIDDHMFVAFGLKIGAVILFASDFRSFVITQGTWILE